MSKNGWIACIIVAIVILCITIACLSITLFGIVGYLSTSPTIIWNFPFDTGPTETITPSPVVIRPTARATGTIPSTPALLTSPQVVPPKPTFEFTTPPPVVLTDTLDILENTIIPINDPIELARRLLNLGDLSATYEPPPVPFAVGAQESFWVGNGDDENFQVQATLRYVTDHAYFWVENDVRFRQSNLTSLADTFEHKIYPTDRSFFGSEWTPGVDGDPHIYILYARGVGEGIAGYFSSADEYPSAINHFSNDHEMFVFNAENSPLDDVYTFGVLAHEFQHMIHWYQDRDEANWINEGFSELAVLLNGFYYGGFDALYTSNPDIQLNNWPDDSQEDSTPHYGASFLFVTYFLDRFGESTTKALVSNQDNDLASLDSTLRMVNAVDPVTGEPITADDFFLDWAVTNYLMDGRVGDGRYSYKSYDNTLPVIPSQTYSDCPIDTETNSVHQYGVDYISIDCPGSHTIHFEGSVETDLLPADPHSGSYAYWSNRSDQSDTTLTQTFDLTNHMGAATLNYWTWYDIEDGWDYAYLEASTDGEHWHILGTPSGTNLDPQGNSYGWGYTGSSGRKSSALWIHESVDLSSYAGQILTLRFEYITDSNVTGEGFMLDDISIPEIGYTSGFEEDAGGWQAAGWARIRNGLPQVYRLALILEGDSSRVINITLHPDMSANIPIKIGGSVDKVTLVVAATTRFTRQLAPYRFNVSTP